MKISQILLMIVVSILPCSQDAKMQQGDVACEVVVLRPNTSGTSPAISPIDQYKYVYFRDVQNGWIAGSKRILKTANGGKDWVEISMPREEQLSIECVQHIEKDTLVVLAGVVDGKNKGARVLLKTTDSGNKWTSTPIGIDLSMYNDAYFRWNVRFSSPTSGLFFSRNAMDSKVYFTDDGGKEWREVLANQVNDLSFAKLHEGLAIVNSGNGEPEIFSTNNGGKTWTFVSKPRARVKYDYENEREIDEERPINLIKVKDVGNRNAWAYDIHGDVYRSDDGGRTWKSTVPVFNLKAREYEDKRLTDAFSCNSNFACLIEESGLVFITIDGGGSWGRHKLELDEGSKLYSVSFSNDKSGWIGSKGCFYKTEDGGTHWEKIVPEVERGIQKATEHLKAHEKEIEAEAHKRVKGNGLVSGRFIDKDTGQGIAGIEITLALVESVENGDYKIYYIRVVKTMQDGMFRFANIREASGYGISSRIPVGFTHEKIKSSGGKSGGILGDIFDVIKDKPVALEYGLKKSDK